MAKNRSTNEDPPVRRSRREQRFADQQAAQLRTLRLVGLGLAGLILLIIIVGLIVELLVVPRQVIAEVQNDTILMADWQRRVRYERSQLIAQIDEQYELFFDEENEDPDDAAENAIRSIQQFSGQALQILLQDPQSFGNSVLEIMIRESLVEQAAANRGIEISQSEIDAAVGERFNYFEGGLPTPFPTPTDSPEPTPSVTPIPTDVPEGAEVVEEVAEPTESGPTVTPFPTSTPFPTNTPVSEESFNEQLQEELDRIDDVGGDPALYTQQVESSLYQQQLSEALFEESGEPTVVPHMSSYLLVYSSLEEAEEALVDINSIGYLAIWNQVRSIAPDPALQNPPQAFERLWLTAEEYGQTYPDELPQVIVELPIDEVGPIIQETDVSTSLPVYVIPWVTGREDRELGDFTIRRKQQEILQEWITEQRETDVTVFENWRRRVPRQPSVNSSYIQQVNTPTVPALDGLEIDPTGDQ